MDRVIIAFKKDEYEEGLSQLRATEPNITILHELPIINGVSVLIPGDRRGTIKFKNRHIEKVESCAAVTNPNIRL